jgi:hypothetical protein
LNILNTATPTSNKSNIVFNIGYNNPLVGCDFAKGGAITKISGTWGENCKELPQTYRENGFVATYRPNNLSSVLDRATAIKSKKATNPYDVTQPETRLPGGVYCNAFFGDCGQDDGRFEQWIRRGGSCVKQGNYYGKPMERPASHCTTGCQFLNQEGKYRCV